MMRRLRLLAIYVPLVGLLAACNIVIQLPFPVTPTPINAAGPSGSSSPITSFTLAPGEVVYYEIDVSSSQRSSYDVLQVEAGTDQPLNLTFYGPSGSAYASASTPDYFASGTLGLASLGGATVVPQSLAVNRTCAGPCVVQNLASGTYYARIANRSSSTANVSLYAFVRNYDDSNEPANNSVGTAPFLPFSASGDSGAIETLGDVDYWVMNGTGTLSFASSSAAQLQADVYTNTGAYLTTLLPGQSYGPLYTGDYVKVYALNNERAGVSGASVYFVTLN